MLCLLPGKRKSKTKMRLRSYTQNLLLFLQKLFLCWIHVESHEAFLLFLSKLHPQPVYSGLRGSETKVFFQRRWLRVGASGTRPSLQAHSPWPLLPSWLPPCLYLPTAGVLSEGYSWALSGCEDPELWGLIKPKASDPDHLGSDTGTPPPLPILCGLPPDVESAIGAPDLAFGEASRIYTDTAEHVLGKKRRLGLESPKLWD